MIILHCIAEDQWIKVKGNSYYGKELIDNNGFIHCSSIENFWRVAPHFLHIKEKLVLLCIDTEKVEAEIKWEDDGNYGRTYPHIYGELNTDSVIANYPFNKNDKGDFLLNEELENYV